MESLVWVHEDPYIAHRPDPAKYGSSQTHDMGTVWFRTSPYSVGQWEPIHFTQAWPYKVWVLTDPWHKECAGQNESLQCGSTGTHTFYTGLTLQNMGPHSSEQVLAVWVYGILHLLHRPDLAKYGSSPTRDIGTMQFRAKYATGQMTTNPLSLSQHQFSLDICKWTLNFGCQCQSEPHQRSVAESQHKAMAGMDSVKKMLHLHNAHIYMT